MNDILNRLLSEIKSAETADSATTGHNMYTSGVFEDGENCETVLGRVLAEVKSAETADSATTGHNMYTSGVFEDGV
jgi:hypothetical protein